MDGVVRDVLWLLASAGLSSIFFMGFWAMWLKTREHGFKKYAYILGPLPLGLTLLVRSFRSGDAPGATGYFQVSIDGSSPGQGIVAREIRFPVADASAPYMVEIQPVIDDVTVKAPGGQEVKASHAVIEEKRFVFFNAVGEGSYLLVLRVPERVDKLHITSMQNR